jgi:molybdate transport system substrate-binding protein
MDQALCFNGYNVGVSMRTLKWLAVAISLIAGTTAAKCADINVFAAASLKTVMDHIGMAYSAKSSVKIVTTFGSSGTLAKQIAEAAPADIFISADLAWMDDLASKGLVRQASRKNIAGNTLVLIAALNTKADGRIENLVQTLGSEKLALGDVKSVPAGKYAKAALEYFGLWDTVLPNVVMQENVRSALALVARGEAKLGIVYGSDARAETKVEVVATFPEASHPQVVYPAAIVADSKNPDAQNFLDYLVSKDGQSILEADGFTLLQ